MPIYEYECRKCKAHTEVMQKMTDKPLTKCRKCGGKLEKQWSPTSFQFKGSGWYVTDYAGKKGAAEEKPQATPASTETPASTATPSADQPKAKETKATETKTKKSASTNNSSGD